MGGARRFRLLLPAAAVFLVCHSHLTAQGPYPTGWADGAVPPTVATSRDRIEWIGNWPQAQALAARHQRLVLVHFWSPDCSACVKLERSVFNQPECIRAVNTNYIPWKVNVAENPAVARDLRVDRWPTDIILSASGQELYRGPSSPDVYQYTARLDQIAAHARLNMPAGVDSGATAQWPSSPGANPPPATPTGATAQWSPATGPYGSSPTTGPYGSSLATGPIGSTVGPPAAEEPSRAAPAQPAYVTNQWAAPQPPTAPQPAAQPAAAQPPIAEQRAAFTTPYGGEFQLPTGSVPTEPAAGASSAFPAGSSWPAAATSAAADPSVGPSAQSPATTMPTPSSAAVPHADPPVLGPPRSVDSPSAPPMADVTALGLDGYCPVTLAEQEKWVKGDPKWGARHRGRLYLFVGPEQQQRFLENFNKYAPALSGYDPVQYSDHGLLVDGKRAHGVFYRGQIYLFADEAALQQFWAGPERYASAVRAEQERSAMRTR